MFMNFFTGTTLISTFPQATFIECKGYSCRKTTRAVDEMRKWINDYMGEEFMEVNADSHITAETATCRQWVADTKSWVIRFNNKGRTFQT